MNSDSLIRVLTVADLHQRKKLLGQLCDAIELHRPDIVACVGDVLDALSFSADKQFTSSECAGRLAKLPAKHLLFVRGNHEDANWSEFVIAWPRECRPLHALYGTAYAVGQLIIVGFPCHTGGEFTWCAHLETQTNIAVPAPNSPRAELSPKHDGWLPRLLCKTGAAGRVLWLLHEPPAAPLGALELCNTEWASAIERYQPLLVVSGHDHRPSAWNAKIGSSTCINVGQGEELRYCIADFHFKQNGTLPTAVEVVAYPSQQRLHLRPSMQ